MCTGVKRGNWIDFGVVVEDLLAAICRTLNYFQLSRDNRTAYEPVSDIGLM